MKVYFLIAEDRHTDVYVKAYINEDQAIADARKMAEEEARHYRITPREEEISGWLYYAVVSCEEDSVRVVEGMLVEEEL